MEKLQWFKFSPTDWFMGKIQRCPEITQARFIRLCCLYWNKDCELSIEDAIIEIDKEHFDVLVSKKIISVNQTNMNIAFLDEQFLEIKDESKNKSKSGIIGNLKRWYPSIYADFLAKKISLEEAINLSKVIARQSHTDSTPIAEQSQSIAEKIREDEIREEEEKKFNFRSALVSLGVETKIVSEWLKVRKTKKATNTETAYNAFMKEVEKSGLTANECLIMAVEKSWSGFRAEWVKDKIIEQTPQVNQDPRVTYIMDNIKKYSSHHDTK